MKGILTYKMTLRRGMKWLLVLSAITRWNWLTDKCYRRELITTDTVELTND